MADTLLNLNEEKARETSMVDLAFEILKVVNSPLNYRDLMKRVAEVKGMSNDDIQNAIAQLYTEINIDGRFACVAENMWGLKRWYPMDKTEGAIGKRFVNDDEDDEEEDDEFNYDDADEDFEALDEEVDVLNGDAEADDEDDEDADEELDGFEEEDADEEIDEVEESDEED